MDENFAYWSASFNEQENGSLRPSPLVPMLSPTKLTGYPLTYLVAVTGKMPPFSLLFINTPLTIPHDQNLTLLYILEFEVSYAPGIVSYHEPASE